MSAGYRTGSSSPRCAVLRLLTTRRTVAWFIFCRGNERELDLPWSRTRPVRRSYIACTVKGATGPGATLTQYSHPQIQQWATNMPSSGGITPGPAAPGAGRIAADCARPLRAPTGLPVPGRELCRPGRQRVPGKWKPARRRFDMFRVTAFMPCSVTLSPTKPGPSRTPCERPMLPATNDTPMTGRPIKPAGQQSMGWFARPAEDVEVAPAGR